MGQRRSHLRRHVVKAASHRGDQDFTGLDDSPRDAWLLAATGPAPAGARRTSDSHVRVVEISARLRPGITVPSAQLAISPAMANMMNRRGDVRAEVIVQTPSNPLSVLMMVLLSPITAALVLVLATAFANASNVMLARAIGRQREIAVRLALGAGRGRVVRQLLAEGLLVAMLAGAVGLLPTAWLLPTVVAMADRTLPSSLAAVVRILPLSIDHRVFRFTLTAATCATLLCALLPALQASSVSRQRSVC